MTPVEIITTVPWALIMPLVVGGLLAAMWLIRIWREDAARRRWRSVFRAGVYEYQQHEDGRRRAVRIMSGESDLDTVWLIDGKALDL